MRKSILRFAFVLSAVAIVILSSCKGGVKDADIEKAVTEKISAASADVTDASATVKDGVVTVNGTFKDDASKAAFETTVKAIPGVQSVVNNSTVAPPAPVVPAPVVINGDEALKQGIADATKDFPGVKAEVKDSVITVTGETTKADWKKIKAALDGLHPKKVNPTGLKVK